MDSSDTLQSKELSEKDWINKWETRNIGFHHKNVHKLLVEFLDEMLANRKQIKIFFPLCGKAVDMKWLADMGHTIIGVDVCEIALMEFFEENNIPYVEEAIPEISEGKVFKSKSGSISLYCCSIYDLNEWATLLMWLPGEANIPVRYCIKKHLLMSIVGKFDGIWDRGGMVAVNPADRERYTNIVISLMDKDCHYLLVTVEYDPKLHGGPPFYISDTNLEKLLGSLRMIKCLKTFDALTESERQWGLDFFLGKLFLITLKSNA